MKKFFYMLLLLPAALFVSSCDDDDNIPDVNITAQVSGAVVADNEVYVTSGETFQIDAINLVNKTGKDAALGVVTYSLDGLPLAVSVAAPYGIEVNTTDLPLDRHVITATMPVYVVDYPICFGAMSFNVIVVEDDSQLPAGPDTYSFPIVVRPK